MNKNFIFVLIMALVICFFDYMYQNIQIAEPQQMLQQQMQNTRPSAPCVVELPANNQELSDRTGAEWAHALMQIQVIGTYLVADVLSSAHVLMPIQPLTPFGLMTNEKNVKAVTADMTGNGYFAVGIPEKRGQNVMIQFQKPSGQMAPMSLDQAAKML